MDRLGEGFFEIADGASLNFPEAGFVEFRQGLQSGAKLCTLCDPFGQSLGPGKVEHLSAARRRVESVGEIGHRPVGLKQKGQRPLVSRQVVGQAGGVLC